MNCPKCRAPMGYLQAECGDCGWTKPTTKERKATAQARSDAYGSDTLHAARFECARFGLTPRASDESDEVFIARINREKTPKIVELNMSVAKGLHYWNQKQGRAISLPENLKKMMTHWLPPEREPGCDDDLEAKA